MSDHLAEDSGYALSESSGAIMRMKPVHKDMEYYPVTEEQLDMLSAWSYAMTGALTLAGSSLGLGIDSIREYQMARQAQIAGDATSAVASIVALNWAWMCGFVGVFFLLAGVGAFVLRFRAMRRIRRGKVDAHAETKP